jgi:hypothetical protein
MRPMSETSRYLLQLLGTLLVLAFVPSNLGKLAVFLLLWGYTFGRLSRPEWGFVALACLFFTGMNAASLHQGIFAFADPDVLRMPVYEFFMWGFYLLHTKRLFGGAAPQGRRLFVWISALLYSVAFATIVDQQVLLLVTGVLLGAGLLVFHEPLDIAYCSYMVFLGALVEYTGVHSGQWHYPGDPIGGVPLWFVTLWGGVGLFLRRLALPILARQEDRSWVR